jgi:hypothetical protein
MNGLLQQLEVLSQRELSRLSDAIDLELQRRVDAADAPPKATLPDIEELRALERQQQKSRRAKSDILPIPTTQKSAGRPRRVA